MIQYHRDLIQGSDEWHAARCGLLTASEMALIVSPKTLKPAKNDKASAHLWELLAQRIVGYVEPSYVSDAMLRGQDDEILARDLYARHYAAVDELGFVTNNEWGFTLGCSPDGVVGVDGIIEIKSRRQKFQAETIATRSMPDEYRIQVQTALIVTGRAWCDFVSYCGGMPMVVIRVEPDEEAQSAIVAAAAAFETDLAARLADYHAALASGLRHVPTERRIIQELYA